MRYLPLTPDDRREMLAAIGARSVRDLFQDVPAKVWQSKPVDLPPYQGELEVERALSAMAAKNIASGAVPSFLGAGAYRHHVPSSVDHLIQRGEFLTSYTPYQPEIAQGTLQMLFEFQTQVALVTGMDVANASMYDGSTAAAEAVMMAGRVTRRGRAVLSGGLHPMYRAIIETHGRFGGFKVEALAPDAEGKEDAAASVADDVSCVVVQYPSVFGQVRDLKPLAEACHAKGALLVVVTTEIVSLGALESPGAMGADMNFGGPYVGLFATREKFIRQMPGRLSGQTVDADGRRGWVLTLSTREQHIRREKATSNICTNAGLCALAFCIHMTLLGEAGFRQLAALNHAKAAQLADKLAGVQGVSVLNGAFFNEFTVKLPKPAAGVVDRLAAKRILAGVPVSRLLPDDKTLANLLLVAATETNTEDDMDALVAALREDLR
jgi:glycine dehydrogenase subunit 1